MAWTLLPGLGGKTSPSGVCPDTQCWLCWAVEDTAHTELAPLPLQSCLRSCGAWTSSWQSCTSEWAWGGQEALAGVRVCAGMQAPVADPPGEPSAGSLPLQALG